MTTIRFDPTTGKFAISVKNGKGLVHAPLEREQVLTLIAESADALVDEGRRGPSAAGASSGLPLRTA